MEGTLNFETFRSRSGKKFRIRFAEENDVMDLVHLHDTYFLNQEPIQMAHPDKAEQSNEFSFFLENTKQKLVLVATDDQQKLVGFLLTKILTENSAVFFKKLAKSEEKSFNADLLNILAYITEKSDILKKFDLKDCFQIFMVCVHADYQNQSIATNLFKAAFALAKSKGFPLISVDCTSKFTSNIAEKLSMDLISTVTYEEYNNQLGKCVFTPVPPHTSIKTFVKAL